MTLCNDATHQCDERFPVTGHLLVSYCFSPVSFSGLFCYTDLDHGCNTGNTGTRFTKLYVIVYLSGSDLIPEPLLALPEQAGRGLELSLTVKYDPKPGCALSPTILCCKHVPSSHVSAPLG